LLRRLGQDQMRVDHPRSLGIQTNDDTIVLAKDPFPFAVQGDNTGASRYLHLFSC
jgi:hypothetical protein